MLQVLTESTPQVLTVAIPAVGRVPVPCLQLPSDLRGVMSLAVNSMLGVEALGLRSTSAGKPAVPAVCGTPFPRPLPASGG